MAAKSSVDRADLTSRILPKMVLGSGSANSLTAPPKPLADNLSSVERAAARFSVYGNAVITGGAGTLALECSTALLEHGLQGLALLDMKPEQSQKEIDSLQASFPDRRIIMVKVNVTDPSSVEAAMAEVVQRLGSIDILACFAGVVSCVPSVELVPEEWKRVLDVNTTGSWFCAQSAARHMISAQHGGSILFIASMSGHTVNFPQPQAAYNVSKSAVHHLTRCLAAEWAVHGIRVNSISPGYMDTILNEGSGLDEARTIWNDRNPMGRMGNPRELTGPVVLMCSRDAGSYITGTDLTVAGGATVF